MNDARGLEVSSNNPGVIAAVDGFARALLSMAEGVADIFDEADRHPDALLLQIYAALVAICGQTALTDQTAYRYLQACRKLRNTANQRELQLLAAVESWHKGAYAEATLALETYLKTWPRDLTAAKTLEFLYYLMGQQYSAQRFLRAFEGLYPANSGDGYFLSSYSFALELTGRYEEAIAAAAKAIEREPVNPWAHHTLGHAYLNRGELTRGAAALEGFRSVWDTSGRAIHSHNSWHLALFYVEALDHPRALSLLHETILSDEPDLVIQQLDAISLLWRLELAGLEIDSSEWQALADYVLPNADECCIPFNSAHYVYALARSGRPQLAAAAIESLRSQVELRPEPERAVWDSVGMPLIDATVAHARGNDRQAAEVLQAIIEKVPAVGGSDAQNDLFRQMFLLSLIRARQKAAAKSYANRAFALSTPLTQYWRSLM